jgi:hypothetical protein
MSKSQLLKAADSVDVMARLKRLRKILEIDDWSLERVRLKLRLASFSKTYGTAPPTIDQEVAEDDPGTLTWPEPAEGAGG